MIDVICHNGKFVDASSLGAGELFSADYVYQTLFVSDYRPRLLADHLELLRAAALRLYDRAPALGEKELPELIRGLLLRNHYPAGYCEVDIRFRVCDGTAHTFLTAGPIAIYNGRELTGARPRAIVTGYDIPFEGIRTGFSRSAAEYAAGYARRHGADTAIRSRRSGEITGVGEWPFFGVRNREIVTPPLDSATHDSVERRLVLEAAARRHIPVCEEAISHHDLTSFSEMFYCAPQGLTAIDSCGTVKYLRGMVVLIAEELGRH